MKEYNYFMSVEIEDLPRQIQKLQETGAFVQEVEVISDPHLMYRVSYTDLIGNNDIETTTGV